MEKKTEVKITCTENQFSKQKSINTTNYWTMNAMRKDSLLLLYTSFKTQFIICILILNTFLYCKQLIIVKKR